MKTAFTLTFSFTGGDHLTRVQRLEDGLRTCGYNILCGQGVDSHGTAHELVDLYKSYTGVDIDEEDILLGFKGGETRFILVKGWEIFAITKNLQEMFRTQVRIGRDVLQILNSDGTVLEQSDPIYKKSIWIPLASAVISLVSTFSAIIVGYLGIAIAVGFVGAVSLALGIILYYYGQP